LRVFVKHVVIRTSVFVPVALAGLLLTLTQILLLSTIFLRRVPAYLPIALRMYTSPLLFAAGYLEDVAWTSSKYALVYVGLIRKLSSQNVSAT
jgi:hypothetical protein